MKKLLAYGFGALAISVLPTMAYAQLDLNAITAGTRPGYVFRMPPPPQVMVPPPMPFQAAPYVPLVNATASPETFNGTSQTYGNSTSSHFQGSNGTSLNCTSQSYGNQTSTNCQ